MYTLPYLKIFKQAWEITKINKFLWIFGLFLVWGPVLSNSLSWGTSRPGYEIQRQEVVNWIQSNIQNNFLLWLGIVILIIFIILYFRAKAGAVIAIKAILDKQETNFSKSFNVSKFFYIRVLGLHLVTGLIVFLVGIMLGGPVMYLTSQGLDFRAGLLLFIALAIFVPISIIMGFINSLGSIFIVSHDLKIGEGFNHGMGLSLKFWPTLVLFLIYIVLISIATFIATAIIAGGIAGVFVILSNLFYDKGDFGALFINGVGSAVAIAIFLTIQSAVISFQNVSWVLAFRELVKPVKLQEEAAAVPEVAS